MRIVIIRARGVKFRFGIAAKLAMTGGDLGKRCRWVSAKLGDGVHGSTLSPRLHLHIVLTGWMSQLQARERNALLRDFEIGKIKTVRGIKTHGRVDTRTMTNRYSCVKMKKVKQDLRNWFGKIASRRIHTNLGLAILKA